MPFKFETFDDGHVRITDVDNTHIHLTPGEALALLNWLLQQKAELLKASEKQAAAGAGEVVAVDESLILATVRHAVDEALDGTGEHAPDLASPAGREQFLNLLSNRPTIAPLLAQGVVTRAYLDQLLTQRLAEKATASEHQSTARLS